MTHAAALGILVALATYGGVRLAADLSNLWRSTAPYDPWWDERER